MSRTIKELAQEIIGGPFEIQARTAGCRFLWVPSRRGGTGEGPDESK